jgi:hypothetical protein
MTADLLCSYMTAEQSGRGSIPPTVSMGGGRPPRERTLVQMGYFLVMLTDRER